MFTPTLLLASLLAPLTAATIHTVSVGESGLEFSPQTLTPQVGDTVIFTLFPRHDVISTAFDSPCVPNADSFYSGPFAQTDNGRKKFVVNVTTDEPVWYYCSVQRHCQDGMVGAWNAPSEGDTIEGFVEAARDVGSASAPEGGEVRGGALLEDEEIASLTESAEATGGKSSSSTPEPTSEASTTASESESPSATASDSDTTASGTETPSATGSESETGSSAGSTPGAAASVDAGSVAGVFAMVLGLVAWLV